MAGGSGRSQARLERPREPQRLCPGSFFPSSFTIIVIIAVILTIAVFYQDSELEVVWSGAVIWKCLLLPKAGDRLPGTPHPSTGLCAVIASLSGVGRRVAHELETLLLAAGCPGARRTGVQSQLCRLPAGKSWVGQSTPCLHP